MTGPSSEMFASPVDAAMHKRLVEIFADLFQIELDPATEDIVRAEVPEWDSFNHVRLIIELEEAFGLHVDDETIIGLGSLRDVEQLLARTQQAKGTQEVHTGTD